MKFLALALLALAAVASAKHINLEDVIDLEDITAYGYLSKIGAPAAERIRKAEEEGDIQGRIVGGTTSILGQFPFQAGLLATIPGGQSVCGGSLLRQNRVITAAHCWFDGQTQATSFTVVLGSIRIYTGGTRLTTTNVVMHESWNPSRVNNDIAIIRLNSNVTLTVNVNVVLLPTDVNLNETFSGEFATASGYGRTGDGPDGAITTTQGLSHVTLPVIDNSACIGSYSNIQSTNICTSSTGGRTTCQGDSGGPLTVVRNNRPLLVGVFSFISARGCQVGAPAAFTRVTSYLPWINQLLLNVW